MAAMNTRQDASSTWGAARRRDRTCKAPSHEERNRTVNTLRFVLTALLLAAAAQPAASQTRAGAAGPSQPAVPPPQPARRSVWNGYERIDFTLEGRPGILVQPKDPAPGRPWIWRAEFFDHQPQVDLALLARGWHVAYMDAKNMYGSRKAIALFGQFYAHLVTQAMLARRVVLEGFSRGGLYAFNFAAAHPTRVAALYLDAPVLDIRSWPGRDRNSKEWKECLEALGLTEESVEQFRGNPLDRIGTVAAAKIPIIAVCGEADTVVPYAENTAILERRYRELGAPIQVILKPGVGHQPHSLEDPTPIVDFLLKHAKF
jgi:pimeloyl-ACP methyl ester carboxylesterase